MSYPAQPHHPRNRGDDDDADWDGDDDLAITVNGISVQKLVDNPSKRISWRRHQQTTFLEFLARNRKSRATLTVPENDAADADSELMQLCRDAKALDGACTDPAALPPAYWAAIRTKILSGLTYRLKQLVDNGTLRERYDRRKRQDVVVWPDEVVAAWTRPEWRGNTNEPEPAHRGAGGARGGQGQGQGRQRAQNGNGNGDGRGRGRGRGHRGADGGQELRDELEELLAADHGSGLQQHEQQHGQGQGAPLGRNGTGNDNLRSSLARSVHARGPVPGNRHASTPAEPDNRIPVQHFGANSTVSQPQNGPGDPMILDNDSPCLRLPSLLVAGPSSGPAQASQSAAHVIPAPAEQEANSSLSRVGPASQTAAVVEPQRHISALQVQQPATNMVESASPVPHVAVPHAQDPTAAIIAAAAFTDPEPQTIPRPQAQNRRENVTGAASAISQAQPFAAPEAQVSRNDASTLALSHLSTGPQSQNLLSDMAVTSAIAQPQTQPVLLPPAPQNPVADLVRPAVHNPQVLQQPVPRIRLPTPASGGIVAHISMGMEARAEPGQQVVVRADPPNIPSLSSGAATAAAVPGLYRPPLRLRMPLPASVLQMLTEARQQQATPISHPSPPPKRLALSPVRFPPLPPNHPSPNIPPPNHQNNNHNNNHNANEPRSSHQATRNLQSHQHILPRTLHQRYITLQHRLSHFLTLVDEAARVADNQFQRERELLARAAIARQPQGQQGQAQLPVISQGSSNANNNNKDFYGAGGSTGMAMGVMGREHAGLLQNARPMWRAALLKKVGETDATRLGGL